MVILSHYLSGLFAWLIRSSFEATILLGLILLIRAAVRGRFHFRTVYWLWMLLLLRLVWPLNLETTFSVFNWIPRDISPDHYLSAQTAEEAVHTEAAAAPGKSEPDTVAVSTLLSDTSQTIFVNRLEGHSTQSVQGPFSVSVWLGAGWLAGSGLLASWVLFANFRLWRIVKCQRLVTREGILELLEDCKRELDLQTVIGVVETDKVTTPCLFGYLRPRLLLPTGTLEGLTGEQLRYVFLHELAHLKRHDIFIGWLMAAVQVLHWFNPAVWYAMLRISEDRELACDELALSALKENEPPAYGATILTFLERFARAHRLPGMAGIAENQSLLKRRMIMIASYKNPKMARLAVLPVMVLLFAATFTSATAEKEVSQGLNDAQKTYQEWTDRTFGSLEDSQYASLSDSARAEMEKIWLNQLKTYQGPGYYDAINALGAVKSQKAFMPLAKIAFEEREKNNKDRWMAVRALGAIGDERVIPKMIHLVYHYNINTRFWAQISLVAMTGHNYGTDWRAWGQWWNKQGKQPAFNFDYIRWTDNQEWADPEEQKRVDAEFIARYHSEKSGGGANADAPCVVSTRPQALSTDVEPGKHVLTVTFDRKMADRSWSWTGGGDTYPETLSSPKYTPDLKTCQMEVILEPGKVYWVGINSPSHRNFKSASGVPANRYVILFSTTDSAGNPTPIPADMLEQAKRIHSAGQSESANSDPNQPGVTGPVIKAGSTGSLQGMIDAAKPGSTVEIPAGTYEEAVKVTKSLILRGASADECILNVTADMPAVFIDTAGGKAHLENVTIQWQLASSDQHEYPFAVAVKDTDAEITNCVFRPLGDTQRSPVAIRSMGFSKMDLTGCDFTGFDYVVCFGEGTKGRVQDCFIRDCGHQGVILYSGAEADVLKNIITGSGYHAVRTTGGKLNMADNLIINNKNRGAYLGNKSGSGRISNNLFIGNATGIDGMSACRFAVENNVILKSTYAAIAARPYAQLAVKGNVLMDNPRGIIIHQEEGKSDPVQSKLAHNVYWKNKTDVENVEKGDGAMDAQPDFIDAVNGNYKLTDEAFKNIGLRDPETIYYLWKKYQEKM